MAAFPLHINLHIDRYAHSDRPRQTNTQRGTHIRTPSMRERESSKTISVLSCWLLPYGQHVGVGGDRLQMHAAASQHPKPQYQTQTTSRRHEHSSCHRGAKQQCIHLCTYVCTYLILNHIYHVHALCTNKRWLSFVLPACWFARKCTYLVRQFIESASAEAHCFKRSS